MEKLKVVVYSGVKYCLFHSAIKDNGILHNLYESEFEYMGMRFPSVEHYINYMKSVYFGDRERAEKILKTALPLETKCLGLRVKGLDESVWKEVCYNIALAGVLAKFQQNKELWDILVDCDADWFVYCHPKDVLWGIGLPRTSLYVCEPEHWRGENKLGYCISEVRDILRRK